jgi:hypothetical protein
MWVLQNLNKETNLTLEEAFFIVWWRSTNAQQPKTSKCPHIAYCTWKPLNITIYKSFLYFNDSLLEGICKLERINFDKNLSP